MLDLLETNPPVDVQETEYQRLLGYPKKHEIIGQARELADAARFLNSKTVRPLLVQALCAALDPNCCS